MTRPVLLRSLSLPIPLPFALPVPLPFALPVPLPVALGVVLSVAVTTTAPACQPTPPPTTGEGEGEGEGEDGADVEGEGEAGRYEFGSRFVAGESSVAYGGQAARQLLLRELVAEIEAVDDAALVGKSAAQLRARFGFFFDFKADNGGTPDEPITVDAFGTPLLQTTMGEVGVASMRDKTRDNDLDDPTPVTGWRGGDRAASVVVDDMIEDLVTTLVARQAAVPQTPDGVDIAPAYVSAAGIDHRRLLERYLQGAVALSQNSDDYLDDGPAGKGLLADNTVAVDGKNYTALEHFWDEGFGYFGAARTYGQKTAADNAAGVLDDDGDGRADWLTEVNFGDARLAAARDAESATGTRFGHDAFAAFVAGRRLITDAGGALSPAELEQLRTLRDAAEQNWERALAATCIVFARDVLRELAADPATYDFVRHAGAWSALKGTLLALQFNPRSPLLARPDDHARAHALVGDRPVIDRAGFAAAAADLTALVTLLADTWALNDADVAAWSTP